MPKPHYRRHNMYISRYEAGAKPLKCVTGHRLGLLLYFKQYRSTHSLWEIRGIGNKDDLKLPGSSSNCGVMHRLFWCLIKTHAHNREPLDWFPRQRNWIILYYRAVGKIMKEVRLFYIEASIKRIRSSIGYFLWMGICSIPIYNRHGDSQFQVGTVVFCLSLSITTCSVISFSHYLFIPFTEVCVYGDREKMEIIKEKKLHPKITRLAFAL